jgi:hypothetical protein
MHVSRRSLKWSLFLGFLLAALLVLTLVARLFTLSPAPKNAGQMLHSVVPSTTTPAVSTQHCLSTTENGMVYPQWTPAGYGLADVSWQRGILQIQQQAGACWLEMPVLLSQPSSTVPVIGPGGSTPSLASFLAGVHAAHRLGLQVFVTPLLSVGGPQPWAGALHFARVEQEQAWFQGYWHALRPYLLAAQQAGVEQFSIGTEETWLEQQAPALLWTQLIEQAHAVFSGTLTYDMNWSSAEQLPVAWMRNADLALLGVSAYFPLEATPQRIAPSSIPALWAREVQAPLDRFARWVGKPLILSEVGYRATADALYQPWNSTSTAPSDSAEQAAACGAVLTDIQADPWIHGSFFWGWNDVGAFRLAGSAAAQTIRSFYLAASHSSQ